ncbi:LamG-like jellyroll fold domain-containing protein [Planctomycetota bacterium]
MRRELIYLLLGCLVLGVIAAGTTHAELVGQWKFDEGAGTTAMDASGNGNDGTLEDDPTVVDGKFGYALAFEDNRVAIPASDSLTADLFQGSFTLSIWINPTRTGYMWQQIFRSIRADDSSNDTLFINNDGRLSWRGRVGAAWTGGMCETASGVVPADQWTHAAVTGDGTNFRIYVNGALSQESAFQTTDGSNATYYIGGDPTWLGESYAGMADDVRIYNHVLSQDDIRSAMETQGGAILKAYGPNPADGAIHLETWASLSWTPGSTVDSHDVYFGESFADVSAGTGGTFRGNQPSNSFLVGLPGYPYPDGLVPDTTYYWRVDEVETDGVTRYRGDVWSFFVPSGKAYSPYPADGAESITADVILTWAAGRGAETHTVYFSDDLDAVANAARGIPQALIRYKPGELEFDKTYYWCVDEFDGIVTHEGDIWSFTTMTTDAFWAAAYYVDGGKRSASDSNPGTEARPWKTIGRGVQSLQPGDTLLIKAGIYRETVNLHRSGTQADPIRIWAYPGDEGKVIINAAEPVTNWRKCAGPGDCDGNPHWEHIYVADVAALVESHPNSAFAVRQVFQHGQLLNRSRYPDVGWSYPTAITDPKTTYMDYSLSKPDGYFAGSVCHVMTRVGHIDQIPITDFSRRAITLAKSPRQDISTRFGYYITSIVGEINEEGEWAYDPTIKRLYLWPKGDVAEDVEFSYRQYCLRSYDGTRWNVVRGLTMRNAYLHGIYLYRSNDMTIENNTVERAYNLGIYVYAGTGATGDRNQIVRNTIKYCASHGICVNITCSYTNIEGNYVYGTGTDTYGGDLMNGRGEAIYVTGPYARVYNNRVDRTGHKALYISGVSFGRDVSYNYVTNVGLALTESGGFYSGGFYDESETDHIHHNIFENVIGCRTMDRNHDKGLPVTIEKYSGGTTPGIYVDERGNNRIIEHNTVINSHMAGIFFHWAPGNIVRNNTLYGNKVAQIWFSGRDQPGERIVDEVVLDNIMFATDAQQKTFYLGINYDDVHFGQSDRNYFYNPFSNWNIFVSRYSDEWIQDYLSLQRWRALSGYDANSKEFRYLDQIEDITIDARKDSRIVYNPSLDVVNIDLESDKYCDVNGNKIYGMVSLEPFESKILIPCDF